jgi:hypothetical protein
MNLIESFPNRIIEFIKVANKNRVKMILVGGGAVNFHGFQRHSADLDFWIEVTEQNLERLLLAIQELGYHIENFPDAVKEGQQNISIKISPVFDLELITNFNPNKTFDEAYENAVLVEKENLSYLVLGFYDLINSKINSDRIKDKLDVEELQRIHLKQKRKT